MPYQTVVFDLDGTLLDTLEDLYRAANAALEGHSLPRRSRDEVRMFVGNGVEMLIRRAVPAECDEETILSTLADFKAIYAAICKDNTKPYDGILPMLTAIRTSAQRRSISRIPSLMARRLLSSFGRKRRQGRTISESLRSIFGFLSLLCGRRKNTRTLQRLKECICVTPCIFSLRS